MINKLNFTSIEINFRVQQHQGVHYSAFGTTLKLVGFVDFLRLQLRIRYHKGCAYSLHKKEIKDTYEFRCLPA